MAIKVGGTTVIDDSRNVDNIGTIKGLTYPSADGTAGQFLKTDGAGNLAFQTVQTDPTLATLTKSFASGETASITLSSAITTAPVVSVIKEVPQTGVSSKGSWDVASDGGNYERQDTAYDTTLTPSSIGYNTDLTYNASKEFYSNITNEHAVRFKDDGTVMYIADSSTNNLREYSLSTAYDPSTATQTAVVDNYVGTTSVTGLHFKPDGTIMYIVTATNPGKVHQYNLSPAWNVSGTHQTAPDATYTFAGSISTPYSIQFSSDGTEMFTNSFGTNEMYQYSLSTAWDVTTASLHGTFSYSSESTLIFPFVISANGTKMFLASDTGTDLLYEYTLSTTWDITTATYTGNTFTFGSGETSGLWFEEEGSVLFRVDRQTHRIKVYDATTTPGLVLGTGSFASTDVGKQIEGNGGKAILTATDGSYSEVTAFTDSSTIASGDWGMFGTVVNATDGLELSNYVNTYDFSLPTWGTAGADKVLSNPAETNYSNGLSFKSDGTKAYYGDYNSEKVYQYSLSTPWEIDTATYDNVSLSTTYGNAQRIFLVAPDGSRVVWGDDSGNNIVQYVMVTPWDLSTAVISGGFAANNASLLDCAYSADGTYFYLVGGNNNIQQWACDGAFNINNLSAAQQTVAMSELSGQNISGIDFSTDGKKMFLAYDSGDDLAIYSLSTAWDISTATFVESLVPDIQTCFHLTLGKNGTRMYLHQYNGSTYQFNIGSVFGPADTYEVSVTNVGGQIDTTTWLDLNTMAGDQDAGDGEVYYAVSTDGRTTWSVIKEGDGVRPIVRDNAGTWEYNSNTGNVDAWDVSAAVYTNNFFSVNSQESSPQGLDFKPDGTKMYICGEGGDGVDEYDLSTPWDVTTATANQFFSTHLQDTQPHAIRFKPDGTKMYIGGEVGGDVIEYTLSTAWDISSASYTQNFVLSPRPDRIHGLYFRTDGLKMYVLDDEVNEVQEYTLSTAWDVSSASYVTSKSTNSQDSSSQALFFKSDGTKMYVVGRTNDNIYEYAMSTAWDVSSATYTDNLSVGSQLTSPSGIYIREDGAKMYLTGPGSVRVFEYNLGANAYTTSATWESASINAEIEALQEALSVENNRMDNTQLSAVTDPNHFTLGNSLDLMIGLYQGTASANVPSSDGVTINYDAEALQSGAVLGTDYDFDTPDSTTVRLTSNATQNLKIRVV